MSHDWLIKDDEHFCEPGLIHKADTQHGSHLLEEKAQEYDPSPSGLPLAQFALQGVVEGRLPLERVVEAVTRAPATPFSVRSAAICEGYTAHLMLVNPHKPHTVTRSEVPSLCGWSPSEDEISGSSIAAIFVNGQRGSDGSTIASSVRGQRLAFDR